MLIPILKTLFLRDLNRLRQEIGAYKDEAKLWYIEKGIANSAGNLCLHLIGNLNTYIGAEFGKTGYIRNRELEFSFKELSKADLLTKIDDTRIVIEQTLDKMTEDQLEQEYPQLVFDKPTSTAYFFVHLTTHLTYHLGQINYHRRLLDA